MIVVLTALVTDSSGAFDSPDFDTEVFSADGIFLESSQRDSLLQALAALAANFPSHKRVDDDLKEKALAIALRLDPLHYNSRQTYQALIEGRPPAETQYFSNITTVSENLWSTAQQLLEAPVDPEEKKLAPFLMELSLLTHPEPPLKRIQEFADLTEGKPPGWNRFVSLEPTEQQSTIRAGDIMKEARSLIRKEEKEMRVDPFGPETPSPPVPPTTEVELPEITPVSRRLMCVRQMGDDASTIVTGDFLLTLRSASGQDEVSQFPFVTDPVAKVFPELPFLSGEASLPLKELKVPGSIIEEREWDWPQGAVAEINCTPAETLQVTALPTGLPGKLPALVLLDTALNKREIHGQFVLSGELETWDSSPVLNEDLLGVIQAAAKFERPYLLFPESAYGQVIDYIKSTQNLGILFPVELISYSSLDEALSFANEPVPVELRQGSEAFHLIEEVTTREEVSLRMSLVDLARNSKVQERLKSILESYPRHLSARAMLEFGTMSSTVNSAPSSTNLLQAIDDAIAPFLEMEDDLFSRIELESKLVPAEEKLSQLRPSVPLELRNYLSRSEDLLEAAEMYLQLNNQRTSIAEQRLREAREAIKELEEERLSIDGASPGGN